MYYVKGLYDPEEYVGDFMELIGEKEIYDDLEFDMSNMKVNEAMNEYREREKTTKKDKAFCKGIQHNRNKKIINFDSYLDCVIKEEVVDCENANFRAVDNKIKNSELTKIGLNPKYNKRLILKNKFTTAPLYRTHGIIKEEIL